MRTLLSLSALENYDCAGMKTSLMAKKEPIPLFKIIGPTIEYQLSYLVLKCGS